MRTPDECILRYGEHCPLCMQDHGICCTCGTRDDPEPTEPSSHDGGCADFYPEYGEPEGGVCKVCGESTEPSGSEDNHD